MKFNQNKKTFKQFLSVLTVFALFLSLIYVPTKSAKVDAEESYTSIVTFSDYQKWGSGGTDDWNTLQPQLTNILGAAKTGGVQPDYWIFGGDFTCLHTVTAEQEGMSQVKSIVHNTWNNIDDSNSIILQGNHDESSVGTNGLLQNGPYEFENFITYMLNEDSYPSTQGSSSIKPTVQATADALEAYLKTCAERNDCRPIFILSHTGLHYDIDRTDGNNQYAYLVYDAIAKYADDLDIVFFFAHNHTNGDELVGGSISFFEPGNTLDICHENSISNKKGTTETLGFYYMNYGYIGYIGDIYNSASYSPFPREELTNLLVCSNLKIYDDRITIERFSANGHETKYDRTISRLHNNPEPGQTPYPVVAPGTPTPKPSASPVPTPAGNTNFVIDNKLTDGEKYLLLFNNTPVNYDTNLYYENTGTLYALGSSNSANNFRTFSSEITADRMGINVDPSAVTAQTWIAESYNGSATQFMLKNASTGQYIGFSDRDLTYTSNPNGANVFNLVNRTGESYPYTSITPVNDDSKILRISNGSGIFKYGVSSTGTDGRNGNVYIYRLYNGSAVTPTSGPSATTAPAGNVPDGTYDFNLKSELTPGKHYLLLFNNTPVNYDTNLYYENTGTLYAFKSTNNANSFTTFSSQISGDRSVISGISTADYKDCIWTCDTYNGTSGQYTLKNASSGQYMINNGGNPGYSDTLDDNAAWTLVSRTGESYPFLSLTPANLSTGILRITNSGGYFKFGNFPSTSTDGRNGSVYIYELDAPEVIPPAARVFEEVTSIDTTADYAIVMSSITPTGMTSGSYYLSDHNIAGSTDIMDFAAFDASTSSVDDTPLWRFEPMGSGYAIRAVGISDDSHAYLNITSTGATLGVKQQLTVNVGTTTTISDGSNRLRFTNTGGSGFTGGTKEASSTFRLYKAVEDPNAPTPTPSPTTVPGQPTPTPSPTTVPGQPTATPGSFTPSAPGWNGDKTAYNLELVAGNLSVENANLIYNSDGSIKFEADGRDYPGLWFNLPADAQVRYELITFTYREVEGNGFGTCYWYTDSTEDSDDARAWAGKLVGTKTSDTVEVGDTSRPVSRIKFFVPETEVTGRSIVIESVVFSRSAAIANATPTPPPTAPPTRSPRPTKTPKPEETAKPDVTAAPDNKPTTAPQTGTTATPPVNSNTDPGQQAPVDEIKVGSVQTVAGSSYTVTAADAVEYKAPVSKAIKKIIIPASVKIGNKTYKVTSIARKAFKGCKKLKSIIVKSKTIKKVGAKAFAGIQKKAVFTFPKAKFKAYKKLFRKKGQKKTCKYKKK